MRKFILASAATVALMGGVSAQAAPPADSAVAPAAASADQGHAKGDPFEHLNRRIYAFDQVVDHYLIRPAAMGYQAIIPGPIRTVVRNVLNNLHEPIILANDLLQAHPRQAAGTFGRIAINTTFGLGGLFDVASKGGLPRHDNSFGVTLGRYGVRPGPYIYLPVAGPSTLRGLVGTGVDTAFDPLYWLKYPDKGEITLGRIVVGGLDTRARADSSLKAILSDATDPYATLRSVYLQNEQSQIDDARGTAAGAPAQALPDFDDPGSPPAPAAEPTEPGVPAAPPATAAPTPPAPDAPASPPPPADAPHTP
jgi:phospholipid-binding lipoprotein MlaA